MTIFRQLIRIEFVFLCGYFRLFFFLCFCACVNKSGCWPELNPLVLLLHLALGCSSSRRFIQITVTLFLTAHDDDVDDDAMWNHNNNNDDDSNKFCAQTNRCRCRYTHLCIHTHTAEHTHTSNVKTINFDGTHNEPRKRTKELFCSHSPMLVFWVLSRFSTKSLEQRVCTVFHMTMTTTTTNNNNNNINDCSRKQHRTKDKFLFSRMKWIEYPATATSQVIHSRFLGSIWIVSMVW